MTFLIRLLIRVLVFGVAITFACRRFERVKVEPRSALPVVALVFAILNTILYTLLTFALNLATLWTLWLVAPLVANALLLLLTDKLLKSFKIETMGALVRLTIVVTIAHLLLRVIERFV